MRDIHPIWDRDSFVAVAFRRGGPFNVAVVSATTNFRSKEKGWSRVSLP